MQTYFYDQVNDKRVYDVSGLKTKAEIIVEFGLDASTQEISFDPAFEAPEIVGNNLQKYNHITRGQAASQANEAARLGKENAIRAQLGLTPAQFEDLAEALHGKDRT